MQDLVNSGHELMEWLRANSFKKLLGVLSSGGFLKMVEFLRVCLEA